VSADSSKTRGFRLYAPGRNSRGLLPSKPVAKEDLFRFRGAPIVKSSDVWDNIVKVVESFAHIHAGRTSRVIRYIAEVPDALPHAVTQ
jgi:hypothetical protein